VAERGIRLARRDGPSVEPIGATRGAVANHPGRSLKNRGVKLAPEPVYAAPPGVDYQIDPFDIPAAEQDSRSWGVLRAVLDADGIDPCPQG